MVEAAVDGPIFDNMPGAVAPLGRSQVFLCHYCRSILARPVVSAFVGVLEIAEIPDCASEVVDGARRRSSLHWRYSFEAMPNRSRSNASIVTGLL